MVPVVDDEAKSPSANAAAGIDMSLIEESASYYTFHSDETPVPRSPLTDDPKDVSYVTLLSYHSSDPWDWDTTMDSEK